jgi:hypothetical protein
MPPDQLQASPLLAFTRIATQKFGNQATVGSTQPQPTNSPQHNASCQKGRRLPLPPVITNQRFSAGKQAYFDATVESLAQTLELDSAESTARRTGGTTNERVEG